MMIGNNKASTLILMCNWKVDIMNVIEIIRQCKVRTNHKEDIENRKRNS